MALSVQKSYTAGAWPLGYVNVPATGTPVCIMTNVDANNVNSGGTPTGSNSTEYSRSCRAVFFQGYKPAANANGMVPNSANMYVMVAGAGNNTTGNKTDAGSMLAVVAPGGSYTLPAIVPGVDMFSPYSIFIDTDANNDGALVTLWGGGNP